MFEDCDVQVKGRIIRLPVKSRSRHSFEKIVDSAYLLQCSGRLVYALVFSCTGLEEVKLCLGRPSIVYEKARVHDRLSGLEMTVHVPVIRLEECSLKPRWTGTRFTLDCSALENCGNCFTVTPRDHLYRSLL